MGDVGKSVKLFFNILNLVTVHGIYLSQKDPFTGNTHRYFRNISCELRDNTEPSRQMIVTMNRVVVKGQVDHGNML